MPQGIEERRLADGTVRYAVRVRRRGRSAFAVFDSPIEAVAYRANVLAAIAVGKPLPEAQEGREPVVEGSGSPGALLAPQTVADAARELIEGLVTGAIRTSRGHVCKPATVRGYEQRLRLHVLPRIGAIPVRALRRGDVRRMLDEIAVEVGPRTAALSRDTLRIVLRRQVELEQLDVNVCVGVRSPWERKTPPRFLTPDEAERLQAAADEDRSPLIGPAVALALATGLRHGELLALRWGPDGLDIDAKMVRVRMTRDPYVGPVETKTRRHRDVPLGSDVVTRMRRFRMAQGRPGDGSVVFPFFLWTPFHRARTAAKLEPSPRFHDLRHTAATFWLAAGLKSHAVAELLGHVDAGLVDRLYGHALPEEVASAGDRLEAWLAARKP
jgi:integrase